MANRPLKTLVITSKITFVPDNYDHLIVGLARCPQVGGLLILDNGGLSNFMKSIGALLKGAYRIGLTLFTNRFGNSQERREHAYRSQGKPVWTVKRLNSDETLTFIAEHQFNLLLNARTRALFQENLLAAPALGAINIHHGMLPEQRGTMCDLWALFNAEPCGFSIHKMTDEIDAGEIIRTVTVSDGSDKDYIQYLEKSSRQELSTVCEVLEDIERTGKISGYPNIKSGATPMRTDPSRRDIKKIKRRALQI